MKKILTFLLSIIIIVIAGQGIFQHQKEFHKITYNDGNDFIIDFNLGKFSEVGTLVKSIFGKDFTYLLTTQKLAMDIDASVVHGKNNWLEDSNNIEYISDYLSFYKERGPSYLAVFNGVIDDEYIVSKEVKEKYIKIIKENYKQMYTEDKNVYSQEYVDINNHILKKYCSTIDPQLIKYNTELLPLYTKLTLYYFNEKEYEKALCYNILSGYKSKLSGWQTLTFGITTKLIEKKIQGLKENKVKKEEIKKIIEDQIKESEFYYNKTMKFILQKEKIDYHRNSNDILEVINLNRTFNTHINSIKYNLIELQRYE